MRYYADQVALAESVDRRSFLGMLDPADREFLFSLGEPRTFRAGARPIVQGDHSDTVFLVISGLVKVTVDTPDGREVVLSLLGPGDLLGEFEVIEGSASTRMAANVSVEGLDCLAIAGERFLAALASRPAVALALMRVLIGRLSAADRRREASASMDVGHSLASYLIELADRYGMARGSGIDVAFPLTQEELAGLISCSRDSAVRGLGTLRARGLIRTMRRRIVVTDIDGLRRFAAGQGRAPSPSE
jgi:CRP/FNR family transcriptional regulator, cyclic AMP receptor protein